MTAYEDRIRKLKNKREEIAKEYDKAVEARSVNGCMNLNHKDREVKANLEGLKEGYSLGKQDMIREIEKMKFREIQIGERIWAGQPVVYKIVDEILQALKKRELEEAGR